MRFLKFIFKIFDFIDRIDEERRKYNKRGPVGKVVTYLLSLISIGITIALAYATFALLKKADGNFLYIFGGVFVAIFALYMVLYTISTQIVYIIVCLSSPATFSTAASIIAVAKVS